MKIRLEGTEVEIINIINFLRYARTSSISNTPIQLKIKSISKFYPNRVDSTALLNGLVDTENPVGRVYVEID